MKRTLVWFRRDLRVVDHEPLYRAARRGAVIPVFVFDRALLHHPETGAARVAFLLACLAGLDREFRGLGGRLILRSGDPVRVLPELIRETEAEGIYAHTDCERIYGRVRDERLNRALAAQGMKIRWFEPTASFSELMPYPAYRERWYQAMGAAIVPQPQRVVVPEAVGGEPLPSLAELGHGPDGKPIPPGGTATARQCLQDFLAEKSDRYYWQLSYPSAVATTGLSPYIKFGVISVRECVQRVYQAPDRGDSRIRRSQQQLISRLRWGQGFAQRFRYLPQLEVRSLYSVFDQPLDEVAGEESLGLATPSWRFDEEQYAAWQTGMTEGYPAPIIDYAQARQRRVQQLEIQRSQFLTAENVVPFLARLPEDMVPFGSDRLLAEVTWAQAPIEGLFPPPLDLDSLDMAQAQALRTWFVAHGNVPPPKVHRRSRKPKPPDPDIQQLSLL